MRPGEHLLGDKFRVRPPHCEEVALLMEQLVALGFLVDDLAQVVRPGISEQPVLPEEWRWMMSDAASSVRWALTRDVCGSATRPRRTRSAARSAARSSASPG